jgi:pyruvate,orthophosphate dikinase
MNLRVEGFGDELLNRDPAKYNNSLFKEAFRRLSGRDFPQDTREHLRLAIEAVIQSWNHPRLKEFRIKNNIPDEIGTAVNVQMMVFGNLPEIEESCSGICLSRDPVKGQPGIFVEVVFNEQGDKVVGNRITPERMSLFKNRMPKNFRKLEGYSCRLEKHFKEIQDIEFTIENRRLWLLQTRGAEGYATSLAKVRVLMDLVDARLITEDEAILRVELEDLKWLKEYLAAPVVSDEARQRLKDEHRIIAKGTPVTLGIAEGKVVRVLEEAIKRAKQGESIILFRQVTEDEAIDREAVALAILPFSSVGKLGNRLLLAAVSFQKNGGLIYATNGLLWMEILDASTEVN